MFKELFDSQQIILLTVYTHKLRFVLTRFTRITRLQKKKVTRVRLSEGDKTHKDIAFQSV